MVIKAGLYAFLYGTRIDQADPPPLLRFRSSSSFIIATIVIAVYTDVFLYSVVVPVLPFALTVRAHVQEHDVQKWTSIFLSLYGAALAVGSIIAGVFADRTTSRRTPLLVGLIALAGSTAILCAGKSLALLLVGRFLQGLSASIVWTVGLALLSDTVEEEKIGQAMGYAAAAFSIGSVSGPLLGGVVYARGGYYAVFGMGFALIGLDIVLRLLMIERSVAAQWSPPTEALSSVSHAVEQKSEARSGARSTSNTSECEIQPIPPLAELNSFELATESDEKSKAERFINRLPPILRLLLMPRMLVSLFGTFVAAANLAAFDSDLPLFVKNTFSWNSQGAGLIFVCLVVPALLSPFIGFLSDRFGVRALTTTGLLGSVPFLVCLRFVTHNSLAQKVLLCILLTAIGFCTSMTMTPLMAEIDHVLVLEEKKQPGSMGKRGAAAQGYGLFNTAYALGTLIGPLWAGYVVQSAGWGTMGWNFGLLGAVAGITTLWWAGGRIMLKGSEGRRDHEREV